MTAQRHAAACKLPRAVFFTFVPHGAQPGGGGHSEVRAAAAHPVGTAHSLIHIRPGVGAPRGQEQPVGAEQTPVDYVSTWGPAPQTRFLNDVSQDVFSVLQGAAAGEKVGVRLYLAIRNAALREVSVLNLSLRAPGGGANTRA